MPNTIRTRFIASLMANVIRGGVAFLTSLLLARWLAPQEYGRMAFLLASMMAVRGLLDMGTASASFTFLSQRRRSRKFVTYYWRWVAIQLALALLMITVALPDAVVDRFWFGESRSTLVLALLAVFMQNVVWTVASQMAEASRETLRLQRLNTLIVVFHLAAAFVLWWLESLSLSLIFAIVSVEWAVAGWLAARLYHAADDAQRTGGNPDTARSMFGEFKSYCLPLLPFAWLSIAYDFADRWMLQHWGGATEQAYFGVGQQFTGIVLLATTSILRIFWKEIAEAHHVGDQQRVAALYRRVSRGLYFIGAVVAGGLMPWVSEILQLTVGSAYVEGNVTLVLMFLYPVHQSLGQITGTMFLATAQVRLYVVLSMAFMLASLVVAYFMMAPTDARIPGLGLASQGLSLKMVTMQILTVNALAWQMARKLGCRFDWEYQVVGLGATVVLGWLAKAIVMAAGSGAGLAAMVAASFLYALAIAALFYLMPWLGGLSREELKQYAHSLLYRVARQ